MKCPECGQECPDEIVIPFLGDTGELPKIRFSLAVGQRETRGDAKRLARVLYEQVPSGYVDVLMAEHKRLDYGDK